MNVARETGVTICPVGVAYQQVYDEKGTEGIEPWFQDDRHPTDMSTYMAACMEYGLMFGEDPATIAYHPASVSDADAVEMRSYASKALQGFVNIVDHTAATVRYQAVGFDQYEKEMDAPADLVYSLTDGGTLDANQVFKSNGTEGTYSVSAKNDKYDLTAIVKVTQAETVVLTFPAIELDADNLTAAENFNTMGTAADATLPTAWRIDRQTVGPRTLGSYAVAQDKTMYAGGASLPSNAKNGLWNFGQGDSDDRAVGGISTGVADGTRCVNLYAHFLNTGRKNIENLTISYDVEKYRKGNNAAGFTVQMYYSMDGRNWTSAGDAFKTTFAADAVTEGYATVPGDVRNVMHFHPALAPVKIAVLPLSKKLAEPAKEIYAKLAKKYNVDYDDRGNIGKRYRREDEIGTPFCVTYDFESEEDKAVTIRFRDSMEQVRVPIDQLEAWFADKFDF